MRSRIRAAVLRALLAGAIVVVAIVGLALWIQSDSGGKAESLGSSLLGGAVVGGLLLFAEMQYEGLVREREKFEAMGSSAEPTAGQIDERAPEEIPPRQELPPSELPIGGGRHYHVVYQGRMRDLSRIDAVQARLVVMEEDRYFQFVTAVAPGPSLELLDAERIAGPGRFWGLFSEAASVLIEDAVHRGEVPLPNPKMAFEVRPDVEAVVEQLRRAKEPLDIPEVSEGDTVYSFDS